MNLFKTLSKKVFIVAEIGNNHEGDVTVAKKLVDVAVQAGVDAVKFQTFRGIDIVIPTLLSSEYPDWGVKEYKYWCDYLNSIALPFDKHKEIFDYAREKGVLPFSTPTSPEVVDFLEDLGVEIFKVASMDITNVQLLRKIANTGKPVIMSTGMASEDEIEKAVSFFDINKLILLHCVADYPLTYNNANLRGIVKLKDKFRCLVGFSDHSLGYKLSIAAVSLGAQVIEKHITVSRNTQKKAEHHFSLEPLELKEFTERIRETEVALGIKDIIRSSEEKQRAINSRRSLHVNKNLKSGDALKAEDISVLRPSDGAAPDEFDYFVDKIMKSDKNIWDSLKKEDVK